MNIGFTRILFILTLVLVALHPDCLVDFAQAQDTADAAADTGKKVSFLERMTNALGPYTFLPVFIILLLGGITLMIYNGIAIRRKAFTKEEVIEPIMQELQQLNIEGAIALCEQYKLPVTSVLKGGLDRIQDDELDIESIEKGLEESSGLELAKPFIWINLLNTIGSISPMVGLLGTVSGMIEAFDILAVKGTSGEASKDMAGKIGTALWTTASGLVIAIPTLISYFIYKNKFGTIVADVNRVAGEMVFTLVRAARGGFDEQGQGGGEEYYEEPTAEPGLPPAEPGPPPPGAPPMPPA